MPSYLFEVTTEKGVERHAFTLDDDRPLGPQVTQILEELRLRGIVLRGSSDDELGVFWEGRELQMTARPGELGISAARPVSLKMRERVVVADTDSSLPRGVLASSIFGCLGAFVAWILVGLWTDTSHLIPDYNRLDLLTMILLGMLVGGTVVGGAALRTRGAVLLGGVAGAVLGAIGCGAGALVALSVSTPLTVRGFLLLRLAGWSIAGLLAAGMLSSYFRPFTFRRVGESMVIGLLAGVVGGALFALPGPSELWQGLAFLAYGSGVGLAVGGPLLWGAAAIVESIPPHGIIPSILSLREWPVHEATSVEIGGAQVACQAGQVALYPPANGASLNNRPVTQPTFVLENGRMAIDGARFRIRIVPVDS